MDSILKAVLLTAAAITVVFLLAPAYEVGFCYYVVGLRLDYVQAIWVESLFWLLVAVWYLLGESKDGTK